MAKKTGRMGRPSVASKDRRETLIKSLVTVAEDKELQEAADKAGLSMSTWLRTVALRAAREGAK